MSLFQSLTAMRGQLDALRVNIRFLEDGRINLIVAPEITDEARKATPELANEFQLVGTAAELDQGLVPSLQEVSQARASLIEQAKRQADELAAAAKTKAASGAKKTAPLKVTVPPTSGSAATPTEAKNLATVTAGNDDEAQASIDALDLFGDN